MRTACRLVVVVFIICLVTGALPLSASEAPGGDGAHVEASAGAHGGGHDLTHQMMFLALQLGVILIAAKLGGEIFERFLKLPAVLGELASGLAIGPYALGGMTLPLVGVPLFSLSEGASAVIPVTPALYGIATFASIVLLFLAGLETDFRQFLRYAGPGGLVGLGGVLGAFVTGDLLTLMFAPSLGHHDWHFMSKIPLFMGTISVATSVGITARVLSEKEKLDTPEGVTILAGAVIDDVLGIIVLAIVLAMPEGGEGGVDWGQIGGVATKAFGIWLVATALMIALAKPLKRFFGVLKGEGVVPATALGIALVLSGIMESFGLAMIIGAYVAGLGLAKEEDLAHRLDRQIRPMYNVIVPAFFCVMGMLVNFEAMKGALFFGIVFSVVAIFSKVIGCGLPTYLVKFNTRGALRVGFGMLPRGEVALIVAGVGLSRELIGQDMLGVAILMTLVTTVMAPPILVKLFQGGPGVRGVVAPEVAPKEVILRTVEIPRPQREVILSGIVGALRGREDVLVNRPAPGEEIYLVSVPEENLDFELVQAGDRLEVHASEPDRMKTLAIIRGAAFEARSAFEEIDHIARVDVGEHPLASGAEPGTENSASEN
jgi:Kef-type K+ transport system membrane component KefB